MSRLHHVCIITNDFDWYVNFFMEVFDMTIERTAKEAPKRNLWFDQGIQINEMADQEEPGTAVHHISIGVEDIPGTVAKAIEKGCSPLVNGAHWFALPNGVQIELKEY